MSGHLNNLSSHNIHQPEQGQAKTHQQASKAAEEFAAAFQKALQVGENYYLLYYSPANYTSDGTYKKIQVIVKNQEYKVTYRQGYFAN